MAIILLRPEWTPRTKYELPLMAVACEVSQNNKPLPIKVSKFTVTSCKRIKYLYPIWIPTDLFSCIFMIREKWFIYTVLVADSRKSVSVTAVERASDLECEKVCDSGQSLCLIV